jgi:FkbM family methyltransferase
VGLKPSLVFRGLRHYSAERTLSFSLRAGAQRTFQVWARDNGLDVGNYAEFFEPRQMIIPPELPPFVPETIYDLGANIGAASLYFAAVYPEARLYGFEPVPANYEICAMNYRNLPGSTVFPWAVGARSGVAAFDCLNDPRGGRLSGSVANPRLHLTGRIEVQTFSIADLIGLKKLHPPDFLKIDVEGAEMEVLAGIGGFEQSVQRIFVETHSEELANACRQWIRDHGFRIYSSADPTALWGDRV